MWDTESCTMYSCSLGKLDRKRYEIHHTFRGKRELFDFWETIVSNDMDLPHDVFVGNESEHNRYTVYLEKCDGKVTTFCNLVETVSVPRLGCLAEVATGLRYRGRGLATQIYQSLIQPRPLGTW